MVQINENLKKRLQVLILSTIVTIGRENEKYSRFVTKWFNSFFLFSEGVGGGGGRGGLNHFIYY